MLRVAFLAAIFALALAAQDPTDAQHVWLDLELFPATQTLAGTCTWTVKSNVNGLTTFPLDLADAFAVTGVTVNGAAAAFSRPSNAVIVTLDQVYAPDQQFMVSVAYSGAPNGGGFGSFTFATHGSPAAPIISSLSEPWFASTWWPCKETLTDKFTTATWVTVPATLFAAGNGLLQGTDALSGGRARYRWYSSYPIATYGVSVTASNYQVRTDTYTHLGASMPVPLYAYPENFAAEQTNMDRIVPMLTTFSDLFGQYPFVNEKYGICQFNWGGGMEHQTITSQYNFSEWLSAHELAHSWWGNCITCATWHDIGLNEGFATYGEALWAEFRPGGSAGAYFSRMNANKPSSPLGTGSVYVYDVSNPNAIFSTTNVYRKGAWVLHQLRHVVGDAAFFQILQDYRAAKDYGSATWADFAAIASASYGQDLGWFIDQCVMRTGAPDYDLGWTNLTIGGQPFVAGRISQVQSGLPYRFPIDLRVTTASGTATSAVWCDQARDDFLLPATGPASLVELDPAPWILRGNTSSSTYAPSLIASPSTVTSTSGGTVTLTLAAGPSGANRPYLVGGSATGVAPGIPLPGGKVVPLVADAFTTLTVLGANGPVFQGFAGTLGATGQATAQIVIPPLPPLPSPVTFYFAFIMTDGPYFTSIPAAVTIN